MRRIRITVAYDGTGFYGWQVQPGLPTIQGTLEAVMAEIEMRPVHVAGSGRTDAGVHARAQVAAFTIENPIPPDNLRRAMNRLLPAAIRVLYAAEAAPEYHPRFDAVAKTYEYHVWRTEICPPFEWRYVHHYPYPLDEARMIALAPRLEGEHDFTAFAAADDRDAEGASKVRTIYCSRLERAGERLVYRVRGSGFLKHMVRNIVGMLLEAGKGNLSEAGFRALLAPASGAGAADARGVLEPIEPRAMAHPGGGAEALAGHGAGCGAAAGSPPAPGQAVGTTAGRTPARNAGFAAGPGTPLAPGQHPGGAEALAEHGAGSLGPGQAAGAAAGCAPTRKAGPTAPAKGLFLVNVEYADH